MRIAFAGTPEFALASLRAIADAGHEVVLALAQPDRPAGRGMKTHASPVKVFAAERAIRIEQPRSLRLDGKFTADAQHAREALLSERPDAIVVAAYGLILPQWVLDLPRYGCLNVHASLLPRWRGAAPIQRAIEAGDANTGVTIMQMDAGLDTGDMLLAQSLPISPGASASALRDALAKLGAHLIVEALGRAACGALTPVPQPALGVSYANKIDKSEAPIDWREPAVVIERRIRALDPFPGATATLGTETFKVWRAELVHSTAARGAVPGEILAIEAAGPVVECGQGALALTELQRSGGKRLPSAAFLAGQAWQPTMRFALRRVRAS